MQTRRFGWALLLVLAWPTSGGAAGESWVLQLGSAGPEIPYAVASDGTRVVVTGTFDRAMPIGSDVLQAERQRDVFVAGYAANGRALWSRALGGRRGDQARGVALDSRGRTLITGYFVDRLGLAGSATALATRGGADVFLLTLDANGRLVQARSWGGPGADVGLAVAPGPDGSAWVSGAFQNEIRFGDTTLTSAGGRDAFLVRLDRAGRVVRAVALGGPRDDEGRSVAVDAEGRAFWVGRFADSARLGRHSIEAAEPGGAALFVARLAPDGSADWVHAVAGTQPAGVGLDARGRPYVSGTYRDTLDLRRLGGPRLEAAGGLDGFVIGLDAAGAVLWAESFGGPVTDEPLSLAVAPDGSVHLAGYFQGRADFDPGPGEVSRETPDPANADAFLLSLDSRGRHVASRRIGGDGVEQGLALAADPHGTVYLAGLFNQQLQIDGSVLRSRGKTDVFLARVPAR